MPALARPSRSFDHRLSVYASQDQWNGITDTARRVTPVNRLGPGRTPARTSKASILAPREHRGGQSDTRASDNYSIPKASCLDLSPKCLLEADCDGRIHGTSPLPESRRSAGRLHPFLRPIIPRAFGTADWLFIFNWPDASCTTRRAGLVAEDRGPSAAKRRPSSRQRHVFSNREDPSYLRGELAFPTYENRSNLHRSSGRPFGRFTNGLPAQYPRRNRSPVRLVAVFEPPFNERVAAP